MVRALALKDRAQIPLTPFEKEILSRLRSVVEVMPEGTARYHIGSAANTQSEGGLDVVPSQLTFNITPTRADSVGIRGFVKGDVPNQEGIGGEVFLVVGQCSSREFSMSPDSERLQRQIEWLFRVFDAVFTTSCCEEVTFSNDGRIVSSRLRLQLNVGNRTVEFKCGGLLQNPFQKKVTKKFVYVPYY